jgi:hypothetical protein
MTKSRGGIHHATSQTITAPNINITKLGIVSRDYRHTYENGYRDFGHVLPDVLNMLDDQGCDAVLFSLFSIVKRESYDTMINLNGLENIRAVFLEEFQDGEPRERGRYVVYHRTKQGWREYEFYQTFATITGMSRAAIASFVEDEVLKRILGNCFVLLCGETNGVKYSPDEKTVKDTFGLRAAIPEQASIILNPIHDRMTRFEMKLKKKFLSENHRWVISVWNKGKEDKNGKVKDGSSPAWTVFHNGKEMAIDTIENKHGLEVGILGFEGDDYENFG